MRTILSCLRDRPDCHEGPDVLVPHQLEHLVELHLALVPVVGGARGVAAGEGAKLGGEIWKIGAAVNLEWGVSLRYVSPEGHGGAVWTGQRRRAPPHAVEAVGLEEGQLKKGGEEAN